MYSESQVVVVGLSDIFLEPFLKLRFTLTGFGVINRFIGLSLRFFIGDTSSVNCRFRFFDLDLNLSVFCRNFLM